MTTPHHQTPPRFSLCVYCGSKSGAQPIYQKIANQVGQWIGQRGGQLVYGGGDRGLMGVVANATLHAGGRVIGVIPQTLVDQEVANHACTELHIVPDMHTRKAMMIERADAFLALPGGIGTFEELFEVWAWCQLGYHSKPIGLLNTCSYYDGMLSFLNNTVAQGFVSPWQMQMLHVAEDPHFLLPKLVQAAGWGCSNTQML
jgi:uncharacterized protein (TIGR00730 family)